MKDKEDASQALLRTARRAFVDQVWVPPVIDRLVHNGALWPQERAYVLKLVGRRCRSLRLWNLMEGKGPQFAMHLAKALRDENMGYLAEKMQAAYDATAAGNAENDISEADPNEEATQETISK